MRVELTPAEHASDAALARSMSACAGTRGTKRSSSVSYAVPYVRGTLPSPSAVCTPFTAVVAWVERASSTKKRARTWRALRILRAQGARFVGCGYSYGWTTMSPSMIA